MSLTIIFITILALGAILLLLLRNRHIFCRDKSLVDVECPTSTTRVDDSSYILELNPVVISRFKKEEDLLDFIRTYLSERIEGNPEVTDIIKKKCDCGNFILMGIVDPQITPSDRVVHAKTRSGASGILDAGLNYLFDVDLGTALSGVVKYKHELGLLPRPKDFAIKVAVLDSGIDFGHIALKENFNSNSQNEGGGPYLCNTHSSYGANYLDLSEQPYDFMGHGTHVAGIILGKDNENEASFNSELNNCLGIINVKIFEKDNASLFDAICGIYYAINNGAKIINLSWGFYSPDTPFLLENAIKKAEEEKIFVVTAAGNHKINIDKCLHWPASFSRCYKNVFTIAAASQESDSRYRLDLEYSNYARNSVHFAAIGTNVNSTFPNDRYKPSDGTSMAAPAVSRYIAWLLSKDKEYLDVINILNSMEGIDLSNAEGKMKRPIMLPTNPAYDGR